jgi:hypothetical protein
MSWAPRLTALPILCDRHASATSNGACATSLHHVLKLVRKQGELIAIEPRRVAVGQRTDGKEITTLVIDWRHARRLADGFLALQARRAAPAISWKPSCRRGRRTSRSQSRSSGAP